MEVIKITKNNKGIQVVSAKELYQNLGYKSQHWANWYKKNILNNDFAIVNQDFTELPLSGRSKDFALSIDFAKRISMLARTEKGEIVRNYFIACENKLKNTLALPQSFADALRQLADKTESEEKALLQLKQASETIQENKPKVVFAESVIGSSNSILVRQFAKDLSDKDFKIGQNRLFEWFRENKYLQHNNEPYQNYIDMGVFEVITRSVGSGFETFTSKTTKITGKGQVYFTKKIKN